MDNNTAVSGQGPATTDTPSTKDDKKREATSPLYPDLTQKKTRRTSGVDDNTALGEADDSNPVSPMQAQTHDIHILSQPINPLVVQIATEIRLMMVPELQTLCRTDPYYQGHG